MVTSSLPTGILIRPIESEDLERLEQFYAGMSPDTLQARFHGALRGIGEPAARMFCGPDHVHREGFVAVLDGPGHADPIVAHVCLEPADGGDLELAVAVADEWQRRGIGHAIVETAADWAAMHGFQRVRAIVRWSNPAILALLRRIGRPITLAAHSGDGCLEAIISVGREVPAAA